MPNKGGETAAIQRLKALLAALTDEYQHRDAIVAAVGLYPESDSAGRMLRSDLEALAGLGFVIEREAGHHAPYYRLTGHERLGREVRTKYCKRCDEWRSLGDFGTDRRKLGDKAVYCRFCNRHRLHAFYAANPEKRRAYWMAHLARHPQRAKKNERARGRRYYQRQRLRVLARGKARRDARRAAEAEKQTKQCRVCLQEKPLEAFASDRRTLDGRAAACLTCRPPTPRPTPAAQMAATRAARQAEVLRMREEGLTFAAIGERLDISKQAAQQLYQKAAKNQAENVS